MKTRNLTIDEFQGALSWIIRNKIPQCNKDSCNNCSMNHTQEKEICGCLSNENYRYMKRINTKNVEFSTLEKELANYEPLEEQGAKVNLLDLPAILITLLDYDDFIENKCRLGDSASLSEKDWEEDGYTDADGNNGIIIRFEEIVKNFLVLALENGTEIQKFKFVNMILDNIIYNNQLTNQEKMISVKNVIRVWENNEEVYL